ncbi:hypothetical protein VNO77_12825 [Canavalia gladiata]|uniref:Plastocyanin-like domain-containing protein n=1 Tax=Canavalia gladiata TaxID=3824 RepID=A0AAN9QN10_CANGL
MPMLHCFFNKAFKASKCATLLKLTIPRIKLLRNRREVQLRQMRMDIAKLLEAGQEATAHVQVEHVIREENMMAAQDIIQLFCEIIVVRLPLIQSQRECPLDLKEAISSVCFAAPRCADLPELLQVQLLFATKYGKKFVSAATDLTPDCGVNRQLIELLLVQAPSPEKKLNLLKEVAVEHKLHWDPTASATKFFKKHEDLLFSSESKLTRHKEEPNSDSGTVESSEVPKVSVWPSTNVATAPEVVTPSPAILPNEVDFHSSSHSSSHGPFGKKESKQFVPFIYHPSVSSELFSERFDDSPPFLSGTRSESKLDKKNSDHVPDSSFENPFSADVANKSEGKRGHYTEQNTEDESDGGAINDMELHHASPRSHSSSFPSFDTLNENFVTSISNHSALDDDSGFSHPNLFASTNSNKVADLCFTMQNNGGPKPYHISKIYKALPHNKDINYEWKVSRAVTTAHKSDTVYVNVYSKGRYNITPDWNGMKQPMNAWPNGVEPLTGCPIKPIGEFKQKITFSTEEGTLWWHAHSDWSRVTVQGAIIVYPRKYSAYPFPKPHTKVCIKFHFTISVVVVLIYLGLLVTIIVTLTPELSLISEAFMLNVDQGKLYLLRFVNAALNHFLFSISQHKFMVVGADGKLHQSIDKWLRLYISGTNNYALM